MSNPTCLRCGYDLRLAPADAACPECGLAVHRSIGERVHPDDCPPGWVRRIATGSLLVLLAYLGAMASLLLPMLVDYFHAGNSDTNLIVLSWGLLLCVIHLAGNLLLAGEDKGRQETRVARWQRRALWLTAMPLVWAGAAYAVLGTSYFRFLYWFLPFRTVDAIFEYSPLAFIIMPTITFERLRRLALRLSRPFLAEHIRIVAVGLAISTVAAYLTTLLLFSGKGSFSMLVIATAMACVALFILWGIALLFFITPKFFESARHAREKWRLADAAAPAGT